MEQLSTSRQNAINEWNNADATGKKILENLYGKEVFIEKDYQLIKTFEDALKDTGKAMPDFSFLPEETKDRYEAIFKMEIIAESLNNGWFPDWDNGIEQKWRPWFVMSPSGFAFAYSYFGYDDASAGCGSRLHFRTEELSDYSAKQFQDIWKKIQLG